MQPWTLVGVRERWRIREVVRGTRAYALKEYVHLIDAGVGDAGFPDELF